jgi:hypothetical protein
MFIILQTLRSLLLKILLDCNQRSARSLAMPLIGTGKHKFPEDVVVRVMKEEFEKFSSRYPQGTLKEIKLVRYDQGISRNTVQTQATSGEFLESFKSPRQTVMFLKEEHTKKHCFLAMFLQKTLFPGHACFL